MQPPPHPPRPLEYQSRAHEHGAAVGFSLRAFLITLGAIVPVSLVLIILVPQFQSILADFKPKLPAITELVITFATAFRRAGWIFAMSLPVVMGLIGARATEPHYFNRRLRIILTFLMIALMTMIILALALPMIALANGFGEVNFNLLLSCHPDRSEAEWRDLGQQSTVMVSQRPLEVPRLRCASLGMTMRYIQS
jgi:hypothetical protein